MATSHGTAIQLVLFPLEKCCSKCGELKTIGAFRPYALNRDGFKGYCTACDKAIYQAKRMALLKATMEQLGCTRHVAKAHLAQQKALLRGQQDAAGLKRCSDCHSLKPRSSFHRSKYHPDGLTNLCKSCVKTRRRAHYMAHIERILAQTRAWQDANRERVRERRRLRKKERPEIYIPLMRRHRRCRRDRRHGAAGSHTESEWRALCAAYGDVCACCGASGHLTEDHIIPLVAGGSDWISNIQPLCGRCNSIKGTRTIRYIP